MTSYPTRNNASFVTCGLAAIKVREAAGVWSPAVPLTLPCPTALPRGVLYLFVIKYKMLRAMLLLVVITTWQYRVNLQVLFFVSWDPLWANSIFVNLGEKKCQICDNIWMKLGTMGILKAHYSSAPTIMLSHTQYNLGISPSRRDATGPHNKHIYCSNWV